MEDDPYTTKLMPDEQQAYEAWARAGGRDPVAEQQDYDLPGYFKATNGAPLLGGHLTDEFKKPNHPTFSSESRYHGVNGNQGGIWGKNSQGAFTFTPGQTNLEHWGPQGLQNYFNTYEKGNELLFPSQGQ